MKSQVDWIRAVKMSARGENASSVNACKAFKNAHDSGDPGVPPADPVLQGKALAFESPAFCNVPLPRWSVSGIARYVRQSGIAAASNGSTKWRRLYEDRIRPWQYRSWILPRAPQFAVKAGRIPRLNKRELNRSLPKEDELLLSAADKQLYRPPIVVISSSQLCLAHQ